METRERDVYDVRAPMNVEPVHQLASAIHTSPKLFACVLGSGISRSAGIRTGWEIVLDLVQRHAEQIGEGDACVRDPAAWFKAKHGSDPDYSEVVSKLATTTDLRRNLLETYFTVLDPVTGQRREHEPTSAHRSIAKLVQRGLLRVIVTTNFDRLMENALREAGVGNIEVVSSDEEAANCYPFHASHAFVFKVHGDWRDTWLRNSQLELTDYPRAIAKLLRRIASEHGLIVCGWSAEYDVALRQAIARYQRRFPTFFVDPKPGPSATRLAEQLRATQVEARGDEFFSELELAVSAIDRRRPPPPLSGDVLVARAKRLIAEKREMELEELVRDATRASQAWIEQRFEPTLSAQDAQRADAQQALELLAACEAQVEPLARLLITLAQYDPSPGMAARSLSSLLRAAQTRMAKVQMARETWYWFHAYPALLCAYAYGVACGYENHWKEAIQPARDASSGSAIGELRLPPLEQEYFVLPTYGASERAASVMFANRIADWLFPLVAERIVRRVEFEQIFDRFDALLCTLSLQAGASAWLPRCAFPRAMSEHYRPRTTFDETVEDWLIYRLDRGKNANVDEPLWEVARGLDMSFEQLIDRLRAWKSK